MTNREVLIPGYVAKCEHCPENVLLPAPSPAESFEVQPYSPEGTWPLLFACPECNRGSVFAPSDFHLDMIPNPKVAGDGTAWWFVEVQCSEGNCGLPVRLHTTADETSDTAPVSQTIGLSFERFRCPSRHQLKPPIGILQIPTKIEF
jgi:hypothetical protein